MENSKLKYLINISKYIHTYVETTIDIPFIEFDNPLVKPCYHRSRSSVEPRARQRHPFEKRKELPMIDLIVQVVKFLTALVELAITIFNVMTARRKARRNARGHKRKR